MCKLGAPRMNLTCLTDIIFRLKLTAKSSDLTAEEVGLTRFLFQMYIAPGRMPTKSQSALSLNTVLALRSMVMHDSASCQVYFRAPTECVEMMLMLTGGNSSCSQYQAFEDLNDGATISNYTDLLLGHTGGISLQ